MTSIVIPNQQPSQSQSVKSFVKTILQQRGDVQNPDILEKVTSGDCLKLYEKVFVSPTIDPVNNYENLEFLGDSTVNKCIIWYFYQRFPVLKQPLGFKIMARLKILYVSKTIFQNIGENKLGFMPYIKVSQEMMDRQKYKVLTDCFEAFVAATEMIFDQHFQMGVGYAVVYNIVKSIFDEMNISLRYEDLFDSITRLKELVEFRDFKQSIGAITYQYEHPQDSQGCGQGCVAKVMNKGKVIGTGRGMSQGASQRRAAEEALMYLNRQGYKKQLAEPWASLKM